MNLAVNAKLNVAEVAKKASLFAATLPAMIVSSPAFALVSTMWCRTILKRSTKALRYWRQKLGPPGPWLS